MRMICDRDHLVADGGLHRTCPVCGAGLTFSYDTPVRLGTGRGMWRFSDRLPVTGSSALSLGAAVQTVREKGIPHYEHNIVGHGIGAEICDKPLLTQSSESVLEKGMVISVETPNYKLGFGGLQTEDTVAVTEKWFEFLSNGERPLYCI